MEGEQMYKSNMTLVVTVLVPAPLCQRPCSYIRTNPLSVLPYCLISEIQTRSINSSQ